MIYLDFVLKALPFTIDVFKALCLTIPSSQLLVR